jgi:hypothetical protein
MAEQSAERLRAAVAEVEQEIAEGEDELARLVASTEAGVADIAYRLVRQRALYSRWVELSSSLEAAGEPVSSRRRR